MAVIEAKIDKVRRKLTERLELNELPSLDELKTKKAKLQDE